MASTIIAAAAINLRIVETFRVLEVAKEDCHLTVSLFLLLSNILPFLKLLQLNSSLFNMLLKALYNKPNTIIALQAPINFPVHSWAYQNKANACSELIYYGCNLCTKHTHLGAALILKCVEFCNQTVLILQHRQTYMYYVMHYTMVYIS